MANWTLEQYAEWERSREDRVVEAVQAGNGRPLPLVPDSRMNSTETRFAEYLGMQKYLKELIDWRFEGVKFVLAQNVKGKRNATTYTPDFLAIYPGHFTFYEVKGFWRDDAKVKLKVAADLFPWFNWEAVYFKKGEWVFEKF